MWLPKFKYIKKFATQGEFLLRDGSEYQGPYTEATDGILRTGKIPSKGSLTLTPIEKVLDTSLINAELKYNSQEVYPLPEDYKKGYMLRYFIKRETSPKVIEVQLKTYNKEISNGYVKGTIIKWILQKPVKDIFNQGYLFKGASTRNKENTLKGSLVLKGVIKILTEFDQFVNIESDVEGYKFEELPPKEQKRIILKAPSNIQTKPRKKPTPRFIGREYPHLMYDPISGASIKIKTKKQHVKYTRLGWLHEKPIIEITAPIDNTPTTTTTGGGSTGGGGGGFGGGNYNETQSDAEQLNPGSGNNSSQNNLSQNNYY